MKADRVIVVLDRDHAAKWLRSKPGSIHEGPVIEGVRAALDRDPAVLETRVAQAIDPVAFKRNGAHDPRHRYDGPDSEMPERRVWARTKAQAVLAALTEEEAPDA
jgi:hypothetical protein